MTRGRGIAGFRALARRVAGAVALAALAGCTLDTVGTGPQQPAPDPAPARADAGPPAQSQASRDMELYLARVERDLRGRGLMRTDTGDTDAPFDARTLARNFEDIAFYQEYTEIGGRLRAQTRQGLLQRWEDPVRISVEFGASVPEKQRLRDTSQIRTFATRLARITGHPIDVVGKASPNLWVLVLNEDERRAIGPYLRQLVPDLSDATIREVVALDRSLYCVAIGNAPLSTSTYRDGIVIIRAESPPLLRQSCVHEELAQILGVANDSPSARPSIFNDDEEFALLTRQDEYMLRILYDRRLRPGMSAAQARPIVEQIATELVGGES